MQSKLESLAESIVNMVIGFLVAILSQLLVFPLVGISVPLSTNVVIGIYFTAISLVRSYLIRRFFESKICIVKSLMARFLKQLFQKETQK